MRPSFWADGRCTRDDGRQLFVLASERDPGYRSSGVRSQFALNFHLFAGHGIGQSRCVIRAGQERSPQSDLLESLERSSETDRKDDSVIFKLPTGRSGDGASGPIESPSVHRLLLLSRILLEGQTGRLQSSEWRRQFRWTHRYAGPDDLVFCPAKH